MRTLWVGLILAGTAASASGTIVNTEPLDAPVKLRPSPRMRLVEIDQELRSLEQRTSGGKVFAQKMGSLAPWMTLGSVPLLTVGLVFKIAEPAASSQAGLVAALAATGLLAGVALIGAVMSTLSMLEHLVNEAATAPARAERARTLRTEQRELTLRI